jgi:SRSO17 transposase
MADRTLDWRDELGRWLKPFLARLGHKARRQMCPLYVSGLIGPGDRKSIQPMARRLALGACDQLHHFIAAGVWDAGPLEAELLVQADKLVGGSDAVLVIDDTAIPKKGTHSVGVAAQYASALGKTANCQTLVSLTLARGEVPVVLALRLFLPESWTSSGVYAPYAHRALELFKRFSNVTFEWVSRAENNVADKLSMAELARRDHHHYGNQRIRC